METTVLLYIENALLSAQLIVKLLRNEGFKVIIGKNANEILQLISDQIIDACIIYTRTANDRWYILTREIRKRDYKIPVIHISIVNDIHTLIASIESGGDDYIPINHLKFELSLKIRRAICRTKERIAAEERIKMGEYIFYPKKAILTNRYDKRIDLTYFEHSILEKLVEQKNCVVHRQSILNRIGRSNSGKSLNVYIHRLRKYLNSGDVWIETVRSQGYKLVVKE